MMTASGGTITLIIAGGQSRRFEGQDKAQQELQGTRLIDRAKSLAETFGQPAAISGPTDLGTGLDVWNDRLSGPKGPTAALWAFCKRGEWDACVTLPVDCPFLPDTLCSELSSSGETTIAATPSRLHPCIGFWKRDDLTKAFGEIWRAGAAAPSMHRIAELTSARPLLFRDEKQFFNINSAEDLAHAEEILGAT